MLIFDAQDKRIAPEHWSLGGGVWICCPRAMGAAWSMGSTLRPAAAGLARKRMAVLALRKPLNRMAHPPRLLHPRPVGTAIAGPCGSCRTCHERIGSTISSVTGEGGLQGVEAWGDRAHALPSHIDVRPEKSLAPTTRCFYVW